jgi:cytoskeletal protein CcmA (bactofilin family)
MDISSSEQAAGKALSAGVGVEVELPDAPPPRQEKKGTILGKFNAKFQDALQTSRGEDASTSAAHVPGSGDLAMRRAKSVRTQKMVVPEGVVIEGSFSSASETEISGQVDGDVTVDGKLALGPSAIVAGSVRVAICKVEGRVDGKIECGQELELGPTGRLNHDAMAGKRMTVAGQVKGNITCGGQLLLMASARVNGNIRARSIVIEEGAIFNGACSMSTANQKNPASS